MMAEPIKQQAGTTTPHQEDYKPGEIEFADTTNNKYPIDSPEHVRSAWSYIHQADNAARYSSEEAESIKARILRAAEKYGVQVSEEREREKERERDAN